MVPAQQQLEDLIALAVQRFDEAGEAGVDEVCCAHAEHASRIRAGLRQCELAGLLHRQSVEVLPPRLGQYRPLRRLGTGGMGVVYLASGDDGREVALKVIRPDLVWFDGARERFRREVEAVASIDHPGVVPVLDVGEQDGVPWFAMEYADGCSLAQVIELHRGQVVADLTGLHMLRAAGGAAGPPALPSSWSSAAAHIVEQVADVMQHVHRRGVLHRDLKPSNIMLRPDGRAQVLDFGLAHVSGSATLTRTGATIGSLAYMSPEQLRGEAVDARTDVYSLGATMYELLTLTPPFSASEEMELRARILDGTCARPRALSPAIPGPLDTLCRAAMDIDRARRPSGMAELLGDLGRIRAGRSIQARLPGPAVRAGRYCRRHPAIASALAVTALFLILLPSLLLVQERAATRVIREERGRAESNYDDALAAVRGLLLEMADEDLRSRPGLAPLREQMFRAAIDVLSDLERTTSDPRARQLRARALSLLGDSLGAQDQHVESRQALEEALSIWSERPAVTADFVQLGVANTHRKLAISLQRLGEPEPALATADRAIAAITELDWPADLQIASLHELTQCHNTRSVILEHAGELENARTARMRALQLKRELLERDDSARSRQGLADQLLKSARLVPFDEGRAMLERAIALARELPDPMPSSPARAELLARSHRRLGILLAQREQTAAAEEHLLAAAQSSAEFLYQNPRLPRAFSEHAEDLNNVSIVLFDQGRFEEALRKAEQAVELQQRALELAPGTERFAAFLVRHRWNQVQALTQLGRPADLAAAAAQLGRMEADPYTTLAAAFAMLLAVGMDGVEADQREEWLATAARLVGRAEAMGQGYDPMLDDETFELLHGDPAARACLERLRRKK